MRTKKIIIVVCMLLGAALQSFALVQEGSANATIEQALIFGQPFSQEEMCHYRWWGCAYVAESGSNQAHGKCHRQ